MKIKKYLSVSLIALLLSSGPVIAQDAESRWVDSVYNSLTVEQRVAQLICMRANQPDKPYNEDVAKYIKQI